MILNSFYLFETVSSFPIVPRREHRGQLPPYAGAAGLLLAPVAEAGYMYTMVNPGRVIGGIGIADGAFGSMPPNNISGTIGKGSMEFYEWFKK